MPDLRSTVAEAFKSKKVHKSAGAIAGFASALSVIVGTLAAYATPRGFGRVTMALHITRKPFIMKLAPLLTGASVAIATAAGILGFYLWITDRQSDSPDNRSQDDST
jgi:ABC-type amino acid transport substrate-binding protein